MTSPPGWTADARCLLAAEAAGEALVLDEPLSFWGGLDSSTGRIIEARHPQRGQSVSGRVLVMPAGRGSSSSSSVFAEAVRRRTGPAAVVLAEPDEIVLLGALVVQLLDGVACPIVVLDGADYGRLATGDRVVLGADGRLAVTPFNHARGRSPRP